MKQDQPRYAPADEMFFIFSFKISVKIIEYFYLYTHHACRGTRRYMKGRAMTCGRTHDDTWKGTRQCVQGHAATCGWV